MQTFYSISLYLLRKHSFLPTKLPQTPKPAPPTFFQSVVNFLNWSPIFYFDPSIFCIQLKRTLSFCSDAKTAIKLTKSSG